MTPSLRTLLASLLLTTAPFVGASHSHAQTAASEAELRRGEADDRLSDNYELRTQAPDESQRGVTQPLDPGLRELSSDFDRELDDIERGVDPAPDPLPERDTEAAPALDLFAGPSVPQRQNLPQSTREALPTRPLDGGGGRPVSRAGQAGADEAADGEPRLAATPPDLFQAIGPVRSPTRDAQLGRQGSAGLDDLRRALPRNPDDPFAPLGLRLGTFVLTTALEQSVGVSDNLTNTLDGARGAFSETTLSARLLSDWSRHEAELNALASYRRNGSGPLEDVPSIDLDGRLRIDMARDWAATFRGALRFDRDDALTSGPATAASADRDILAYSASASLVRNVGRLETDLALSAVREDRDDGLFDGTAFRADDSFTTWSAGLRAGYEIAPALRPFVAGSLGRRLFDEDMVGALSRDSVIPALRGGLAFEWGEKLSGEVALGYAWNLPDADALEADASPTIDATVNWSPLRGTDVVLRGETFFDPDTSGLATSTLYQGSLGVRHRATARLDLEARLVAGLRDGTTTGDETLYAAETGLTFWLNRYLAFTTRYRYDRFDSPLAGLDYDANTFRIGLRVQR